MAAPDWVAGSDARGTNPTLPTPTGVQDGDLLLVTVWKQLYGTFTAPSSGWSLLFSVSPGTSSLQNIYGYYRFASSEGANLGAWTANGYTQFVAGAWRGVDPSGTIVVGTPIIQSSGPTTLAIPGVTTGVDDSRLVALYEHDSGSTDPSAPSGMTARVTKRASYVSLQIADEAIATAGTTGTRTAGVSAYFASSGLMIALPPAPPPPPISLSPAAKALTITRSTPTVSVSKRVAPTAKGLATTMGTPKVGHSARVAPLPIALGVAMGSAKVGHSGRVSPAAAGLSVTPATATVTVDHIVKPTAKGIAITPAMAKVGASRTIIPTAASLTTTRGVPSVGVSFVVRPTGTSLAITPATAKVGHSGRVAPTAASLTLALAAAKVGPSYTLSPGTATLTLTLEQARAGTSQRIAPDTMTLAIAMGTPSVKLGSFIRPTAASLFMRLLPPGIIGYMPDLLPYVGYGEQAWKALRGIYGPVRLDYVFEIRKVDYSFVADITPWVIQDSASINLNNDRSVCRQLRIKLDVARRHGGATLDLDVLADHIVPRARVKLPRHALGWPTEVDAPLGLFQLTWPDKTFTPGGELWDVEGGDLCMQLQQDGPTNIYTVPASEDVVTGTNGVASILNALGIRHTLTASGVTRATPKQYDVGDSWLSIINDQLDYANWYSLTFDRVGQAGSRTIADLNTIATARTYDADTALLIPWKEQGNLNRFANRVVVTVDDPTAAPLYSVATNSDPDNAVSTVALGRTVTKWLTAAVADQTALDARAFSELQQAAAFYRTADLLTVPDPLREPREMYLIDVPGASEGERWQVRDWDLPLRTGAQMKHTLSRVEKLVAS